MQLPYLMKRANSVAQIQFSLGYVLPHQWVVIAFCSVYVEITTSTFSGRPIVPGLCGLLCLLASFIIRRRAPAPLLPMQRENNQWKTDRPSEQFSPQPTGPACCTV